MYLDKMKYKQFYVDNVSIYKFIFIFCIKNFKIVNKKEIQLVRYKV